MRKLFYCPLLWAVLLCIASCSKEAVGNAAQNGSDDIVFGSASIETEPGSKAESSNVTILKSLDAGAPELAVCESAFPDIAEAEVKSQAATQENLGTMYGKFMASAYVDDTRELHMSSMVRYNDGNWVLDRDGRGQKYTWPMDEGGTYHALDFWAYTPDLQGEGAADSFAVLDESSIDQLVFQANLSVDGLEGPYTKDLIVAYKRQSFDRENPAVSLQFRHALAAVGAYEDPDPYGNVTIVASRFEGILTEGKCVCAASGDGNVSVTWIPTEVEGSYASSFEGDDALSRTNNHFLMPQTLGPNAKVTITVKRDDDSLTDYSYSLAGTKWEPGRSYTYKLNYTSGALLMQGPSFNYTVTNKLGEENQVESVEFKVRTPYKDLPYTVTPFVVSDPSSKAKIYAVYDGNTKKLTITTSVDEMYANTSMSEMFYCSTYSWNPCFSTLRTIDFGELIISNVIEMSKMFAGCKYLSTLDVSNWKTSNVTNMMQMFQGCRSLSSLDVSNWKTSNVTNMGGMFDDCRSLSTLEVSNWNTSNVTNMRRMFSGCSSLSSLDVSNWKTSNVTNMGGMFDVCRSLSTLDVSNWRTSNVTDMQYMFYDCKQLSTLDVSNWNTSNVTDMSGMFDECKKLSTLDVSNWRTSNVTNMHSMFYSCTSLSSLDVSNWNTSNVTNMGGMFSGCSSLSSLDVSNWKTSNVTIMNDMFSLCLSLSSLDVSNWNTSNVTDMSGMFGNCSSLSSLEVSNWDTSNVTIMYSLFYECNYLSTLDVSNWKTSNVTTMMQMFQGCHSLSSLDVSNWKTSNVTNMGYMFDDCRSLSTLDVSNWNTSNVTDMSGMFDDCHSLSSLDVSNWKTNKVLYMSSMFYNMYSLKSIKFGENFVIGSQTHTSDFMTDCGLNNTPEDKGQITCSDALWTKIQTMPGFDPDKWEHVAL